MIPAHVIDAFYRSYHHRLLHLNGSTPGEAHRQAVEDGLRAAIPAYLHHMGQEMRAQGSGRLAIVVSHSLDGIAAELEPPCAAHDAPDLPLPTASTPPTCSASARGTASAG